MMENAGRHIFLIGFMGTGKSTVSRLLSRTLEMEMLEMDETIAREEGMSIQRMFQEKGEAYFRRQETALLERLRSCSSRVVSCGGGVILRKENVQLMHTLGTTVWLTARPETILGRVKNDHSRPLLENRKDVASISDLMEERRADYGQAADMVVETDGKAAGEICREIIKKIKEIKEMEGMTC